MVPHRFENVLIIFRLRKLGVSKQTKYRVSGGFQNRTKLIKIRDKFRYESGKSLKYLLPDDPIKSHIEICIELSRMKLLFRLFLHTFYIV